MLSTFCGVCPKYRDGAAQRGAALVGRFEESPPLCKLRKQSTAEILAIRVGRPSASRTIPRVGRRVNKSMCRSVQRNATQRRRQKVENSTTVDAAAARPRSERNTISSTNANLGSGGESRARDKLALKIVEIAKRARRTDARVSRQPVSGKTRSCHLGQARRKRTTEERRAAHSRVVASRPLGCNRESHIAHRTAEHSESVCWLSKKFKGRPAARLPSFVPYSYLPFVDTTFVSNCSA
ncbi:hypothetical protein V9T40_007410 [Parthenolecanium corni]|uniref:Uncharacterized protein n=1 Tax=Parthenolecanium corni TaxID=536013 RepID=A0AAN9YBR7_9HEMI